MKYIQTFLTSTGSSEARTYLAARQQLREIGYVAMLHLTEIMLHGTEQQGWRAARLLTEINDIRMVHAFVRAIGSQHVLVRQAAINALGDLGDLTAVPGLLERLPHEAGIIQMSIIEALGNLGDPRSVVPLLALLSQTESAEIQHCVIKTLGRLGDGRATSILPAFFESEDRHVRSRSREVYQQLTALNHEEI